MLKIEFILLESSFAWNRIETMFLYWSINDKHVNNHYVYNLEEEVGILIIISFYITHKKIIVHDNYDFCGLVDEYISFNDIQILYLNLSWVMCGLIILYDYTMLPCYLCFIIKLGGPKFTWFVLLFIFKVVTET